MVQDAPSPLPTMVLVGPDAGLLNPVAAALGPARWVTALVIAEAILELDPVHETEAGVGEVEVQTTRRQAELMMHRHR